MSKTADALRKIEENRSKNSPYPFSPLNLDPPKPESKLKKALFTALLVFFTGVALIYALGLYLEKHGAGSPAVTQPALSVPAEPEPAAPPVTEPSADEISLDQYREFFKYMGMWTLPEVKAVSSAIQAANLPPAEVSSETEGKEAAKAAVPYFTIQVATFKTKTQASQEAEHLGKKGYEAFVVPANKFFFVCVNRFETKKLAAKKLSEIRTGQYHDAYIRTVTP